MEPAERPVLTWSAGEIRWRPLGGRREALQPGVKGPRGRRAAWEAREKGRGGPEMEGRGPGGGPGRR